MKEMSAKSYMCILVVTLVVLLGSAFAIAHHLYVKDVPYRGVDVLRQYQFAKFQNFDMAELVVVGDSSAGNAIDAMRLSKETGRVAISVALTGSFGLTATYNMIRHAVQTQPSLRYVLIVHSLDIWHRSFSEEGYTTTLYDLPAVSFEDVLGKGRRVEEGRRAHNLHEIYWYLRYLAYGVKDPQIIDMDNDYIMQNASRFSNEELELTDFIDVSPRITKEKIRMLEKIGRLCADETVICVYMHGPIHRDIYAKSIESIKAINKAISDIPGLVVITKSFSYSPHVLGDAEDHVDPAYKQAVTDAYATLLTPILE